MEAHARPRNLRQLSPLAAGRAARCVLCFNDQLSTHFPVGASFWRCAHATCCHRFGGVLIDSVFHPVNFFKAFFAAHPVSWFRRTGRA